MTIDLAFLDLMRHLSDFQEMTRGTASSASYGHRTISRTTGAATTADVRSRLRDLTAEEIEAEGREGEIINDYILYVPSSLLPTKLRDPKNCVLFRVMNVRTLDGAVVEAGPLDVQSCRPMAGEDHHYQVRVRKAR